MGVMNLGCRVAKWAVPGAPCFSQPCTLDGDRLIRRTILMIRGVRMSRVDDYEVETGTRNVILYTASP